MAKFTLGPKHDTFKETNPGIEKCRIDRKGNVSEDVQFNWAKAFACMSEFTLTASRGAHSTKKYLSIYRRGW